MAEMERVLNFWHNDVNLKTIGQFKVYFLRNVLLISTVTTVKMSVNNKKLYSFNQKFDNGSNSIINFCLQMILVANVKGNKCLWSILITRLIEASEYNSSYHKSHHASLWFSMIFYWPYNAQRTPNKILQYH